MNSSHETPGALGEASRRVSANDIKVTTCVHGTPALELTHASPALHAFLRGIVADQFTGSVYYKLRRKAGAFLQGGSDLTEGWILIEFWKPAGAEAFVDHVRDAWDFDRDQRAS